MGYGTRFSKLHRPDLKSKEDFINEIKSELLNSIVFANDNVVKSIADFYDTPVDYTEGGDIVYNGMMALSVDLLTPDMPFYILDRGNDFTKIKYSLSGSNFERVGWIETKLIK